MRTSIGYLTLLLQALSYSAVEGQAKLITVNVGQYGNHDFYPSTIEADVDDIVLFHFFPTNHSIIRGEYAALGSCGSDGCNPCIPYEMIHPEQSDRGFNSGNIFTDSALGITSFSLTVKGKDPIWYYCGAPGSCTRNGMVGAINPGKGQSLSIQKDAAKNAEFQLIPGESWPAESATAIGYPSSLSNDRNRNPYAGIAIASITISCLLIILALSGVCFLLTRLSTCNRKSKHDIDDEIQPKPLPKLPDDRLPPQRAAPQPQSLPHLISLPGQSRPSIFHTLQNVNAPNDANYNNNNMHFAQVLPNNSRFSASTRGGNIHIEIPQPSSPPRVHPAYRYPFNNYDADRSNFI